MNEKRLKALGNHCKQSFYYLKGLVNGLDFFFENDIILAEFLCKP